jgi:DNA-binding winged helix-turn-helix (wHTH) protein
MRPRAAASPFRALINSLSFADPLPDRPMAIERFGDFELDLGGAQLRLRGREVPLQPRIFDLLAHLVRNRDRVVDKDELLAAVWPGVIVTDASLQRAVSLARAALRQGALADAIRTHARRGYRFVADAAQAPGAAAGAPLERARELAAQLRWREALDEFALADARAPLGAADLEHWGVVAQCAGALGEAAAALQRAAAAYAEAHELRAAARATIGVARARLESREDAVARGCLQRAASLLEGEPLCLEHGHLAWMSSRYSAYTGEIAAALAHAERTLEIGKTLGSPDLDAAGRLYKGAALQALGETRRGLALQDEAGAAVLSGNVSPLIGGIIYCGLVIGYRNAGDWPRARQWNDSFTRWCESSGQLSYGGSCTLHRAELLATRGELDRAQAELLACSEMLRVSAPWAVGDASRLLGDVHLARGEFEQAETAYREAHEHGWDPYPGYALLQHYRGKPQAALRGLRAATEGGSWEACERRAGCLAHAVMIAAMAGELDEAAATLARLEAEPERWATGAVHAYVLRARGEVALARAEAQVATRHFRASVRALQDLGARLDAAVVRLRLAAALARSGDSEGAALELGSATRVLEKAGARFYVGQADALRGALAFSPDPPKS